MIERDGIGATFDPHALDVEATKQSGYTKYHLEVAH
jgi:hypothetical protein